MTRDKCSPPENVTDDPKLVIKYNFMVAEVGKAMANHIFAKSDAAIITPDLHSKASCLVMTFCRENRKVVAETATFKVAKARNYEKEIDKLKAHNAALKAMAETINAGKRASRSTKSNSKDDFRPGYALHRPS